MLDPGFLLFPLKFFFGMVAFFIVSLTIISRLEKRTVSPYGHFRSMERAGLIRFTDASATQFYYTLPGAAKTATWSYLVGVIRGLSHGSLLRSA